MNIAIVVAVADNGVIGNKGTLPWHMPADLAHFKALTINTSVIMGRKTYEAISKPLADRQNIIVSRNPTYVAPECTVVPTFDTAIAQAESETVCIIGGVEIFKAAMAVTDTIYLTEIHTAPQGDTVFDYDKSIWQEVSREVHTADTDNQYSYDFVELQRVIS